MVKVNLQLSREALAEDELVQRSETQRSSIPAMGRWRMSAKVVMSGKIRRIKVDRSKLSAVAAALGIPAVGIEGIFLHITAGRGASGATPTASSASVSRSTSATTPATRRRK
jgi:hypothetical protein